MKPFSYFVSKGIVKKQSPNKPRAISLLEEAETKHAFIETALTSIAQEKMSPNFIVDYSYDVLMELIRAALFNKGYNAGNSHEAEVSYAPILGLSPSNAEFLDELRYYRNGIKYYGAMHTKDYAHKVLTFMRTHYPFLKKKIIDEFN